MQQSPLIEYLVYSLRYSLEEAQQALAELGEQEIRHLIKLSKQV